MYLLSHNESILVGFDLYAAMRDSRNFQDKTAQNVLDPG